MDLSNSHTIPVDTPARDKPDVETLARMLARGEFTESYDDTIREMSDDEFEHYGKFSIWNDELQASFRRVMGEPAPRPQVTLNRLRYSKSDDVLPYCK